MDGWRNLKTLSAAASKHWSNDQNSSPKRHVNRRKRKQLLKCQNRLLMATPEKGPPTKNSRKVRNDSSMQITGHIYNFWERKSRGLGCGKKSRWNMAKWNWHFSAKTSHWEANWLQLFEENSPHHFASNTLKAINYTKKNPTRTIKLRWQKASMLFIPCAAQKVEQKSVWDKKYKLH